LETLFLPSPEVECIGNGKASAPYEFGVKAFITTTNARSPAESRTLQLIATHWGEDWHFIFGADRFAGPAADALEDRSQRMAALEDEPCEAHRGR
jgi:hypothetical protein